MRKNVLRVVLLVGFSCAAAVWAEESGVERNPFLPGTGSPAAPHPSSSRDEWGRDPFSNPFGKGKPEAHRPRQATGTRMLTGIVYSSTMRLAIFGGEVLREGSRVGEKKIQEIRRKSIIIMDAAGSTEEIILQDQSVEQ
jgi:hypothetical protein